MSEPTASVLATQGLSVRFGGVTAVDNVSFTCRRGELTGLIGPNGAGKTTSIDAVTGFLPGNASGKVLLNGHDVLGKRPHAIAHLGLTRTWQTLELFDDIDVRANLDVAAQKLTIGGGFADFFSKRTRNARVDEVLDLLRLSDLAERLPRELSQGQRKLVGVARALVADSQLLLLDEPAAGLDRAETDALGERLRELVEEGYSILLVDHDMGLVLNVCDQIHMLVFGRHEASGTPEQMRRNPKVIGAYLGHRSSAEEGTAALSDPGLHEESESAHA